MIPIVKVIGHTNFNSVPSELLPVDEEGFPAYSKVASKKQDIGTDAERLIECAGRTCYDSYAQGRPSADYHTHIKEVGHGSVTEHATINFYLDNLSRGCTHELVRHRAGVAISQRSTRYVDESSSSYILHPLVNKYAPSNPRLMEVGNVAMSSARTAYTVTVDVLQSCLIADGVDKITARKQARGAARGYLGNALCTSMVWSANIRALRGCLEQRANAAADAEIRVLFNHIFNAAKLVCPAYFADYEMVSCPDGIGFGLVTKYKKI
jgi:thymidylate synthase (FAD)